MNNNAQQLRTRVLAGLAFLGVMSCSIAQSMEGEYKDLKNSEKSIKAVLSSFEDKITLQQELQNVSEQDQLEFRELLTSLADESFLKKYLEDNCSLERQAVLNGDSWEKIKELHDNIEALRAKAKKILKKIDNEDNQGCCLLL